MSKPYWWFDGETVEELRDRLNAAGDGARLEVHLDGKKMTLAVVPKMEGVAAAILSPLNKSHYCPPDCP